MRSMSTICEVTSELQGKPHKEKVGKYSGAVVVRVWQCYF